MSAGEAETQHCAECDYALEGLPPSGTCPECGTLYDERFTILRGYAAGRGANYRNASPKMVPIWILLSFGGLLLQTLVPLLLGGWRHVSTNHVVLFVVVIISGVTLLKRWDLSGPPCQLWLCEEGYWFRDRTERGLRRRTKQLTGWLAALMGIALVVVLCFVSKIIGGIFLIVVVLGVWLIYANRHDQIERHRAIATPVGRQVEFLQWSQVDYINVMVKSRGRFMITIKPLGGSFFTLQSVSTVSLLTEIPPAQAAQIQVLAAGWIQQQRAFA